jgi:8-hydroxy-5-deazaflavin:NADPH oxidoreductase
MNVSIIGTGKMGRAIAARMLAGGNNVTFFSRSPETTKLPVQNLLSYATREASIDTIQLGEPIHDPIVILAVSYPVAEQIIAKHGGLFAGKIVVDITNPINPTYDGLRTPPDSSAAEEFAKNLPENVKVIKAFNLLFAGLLIDGKVGLKSLDVLIAGDDMPAKQKLSELLEAGGLRPIDVGPLKRAGILDGMGLLLISLQGKLEKPWMNSLKFEA